MIKTWRVCGLDYLVKCYKMSLQTAQKINKKDLLLLFC